MPSKKSTSTKNTKNTKNRGTRYCYVHDILGNRISLTSRRLTEIHTDPTDPVWYALNTDIKKSHIDELSSVTIATAAKTHRLNDGSEMKLRVQFGPEESWHGCDTFIIGCHIFSQEAFLRILRNAGVKTTAKALAAKAGA